MKCLALAIVLFANVIRAFQGLQTQANDTGKAWTLSQFKNFIVFGDSYSDESRFPYFLAHNGSAPPPGTILPQSIKAPDGGRTWARYVVQYTQQALTIYNYGVNGAACSNKITPRVFNATLPLYPDLDGYEIPAFLADKQKGINIDTGGHYFEPALTEENAVYAFWVGINDITIGGFFDDSQAPGAVLSDAVDCVYKQIDRIYASGGRYFVLFNIVPFELTPLFANASEGGETPNYFWQDKPENQTQVSLKMTQFTTTLNTVYEYRTPFEVMLAERYPGAKLALYDVNRLWLDIHSNPSLYLNGTPPLRPTEYINHCNLNATDCVERPSPDSYFWYDLSHPSEQVMRIVARNFVDVIGGRSEYARYYECLR
ncbi:MAG: hypothetical protein M1831_000662 [Alyxoria varia]|nr:MAG: hypothetical protein M1831_000662 [Alyxoria varia]